MFRSYVSVLCFDVVKFDLPSMNLKMHLKKPLRRKADKTSSSDPKCNRLLMPKDSFTKRRPFAIVTIGVLVLISYWYNYRSAKSGTDDVKSDPMAPIVLTGIER